MIQVTKTFLPPQEEYFAIIKNIWETNQIANGGELHQELSIKLKKFLGVENIILTANGTLPLQISLKELAGKGEVITTPFSYVATTSSIVWENCTPVFVDIDPEYLTIDERKIEAAITHKTTAILATHVFGNPCNIVRLKKIADNFNLKIIYDAAHCFGVRYKGESIFNFGDVSTCSFHATKLFHTGEGGAMVCRDEYLYSKLFDKHNFGHNGELDFSGLGVNAKMSELQAGMGLAVLPYISEIISYRKRIVSLYDEFIDSRKIQRIKIRDNSEWNYSYYPIILENEHLLLEVQKALNREGIYPRRYFYPSLNTLNYVSYKEMPHSERISKAILCLPLFYKIPENQIITISRIINKIVER